MIPTSLSSRRGIVLTLDISIAMMVLLAAVAMAYASYGSSTREGFDDQLMRSYLQDAATVMANKGYLSAPTESQNGTNTTGIREVLRATPSTVCMQVSGFGTVVGQDLAAYWKFDEDSGVVVSDSSGNGQSGTIYGGGSLNSMGKNGHSLTLDGTSGYVNMSQHLLDGACAGTVSMWLKRNGWTESYMTALAKSNGGSWPNNHLQISRNGATDSLVLEIANNTASTTTGVATPAISAGTWYHVAMAWNGTALTGYLNGVQIGSYSTTICPASDSTQFSIGKGASGTNRYWNGSIDEVRLYDRALTPDEIKLLYSNPSNILYVVDKPECAFSGGEVQSLTVPFVSNLNQEQNSYYYATLRAWLSGASK